jgi:Flp pilus assembly protein TadD
MRRALAIDERSFGEGHPNVAIDLNNMAALIAISGDRATAMRLYQRALAILEDGLGASHPSTEQVRANLARFLNQ